MVESLVSWLQSGQKKKAKFLEKTQELLAISPTPEHVPDQDIATDAELKRFC